MGSLFYSKIHACPIIAAVTDMEKLKEAVASPCEIVFMLTGNIFNIREAVQEIKQNHKMVFVHLDLLEGLSKDSTAIKYLNKTIEPDGIITIKSGLIKIAREMGMFAIQRLFFVDSLSVESGIKTVNNSKPDAIEIMPGIMHSVTSRVCNEVRIPVITGGLINDKDDVIACLKAGAMGISTSNKENWYL